MRGVTTNPNRSLYTTAILASFFGVAQSGRADVDIYRRTLAATALVEVPRPNQGSRGTCWVIDKEKRLAITCQHVVANAAEVLVYFPASKGNGVIHEYAHYRRRVAPIRGRVVHQDAKRDLALLCLDSVPEGASELSMADASVSPGETVHSVGNAGASQGALWRYTAGTVRLVYHGTIRSDGPTYEGWIVETQSPINPGDSGGPVVNKNGELVAVVSSMETQARLVSHNVDVREIREFLSAAAAVATSAERRKSAQAAPEISGNWKLNFVNLEGEQLPGTCQFSTDGSYVLSYRGPKGDRTIRGVYGSANGCILLACDQFEVRTRINWARDKRFTFMAADGLLIFDRLATEDIAQEPKNKLMFPVP